MLKSMGLGLHKLDLGTPDAKRPVAATPSIPPEKALVAAKAQVAPTARAATAVKGGAAPDTARAPEEAVRTATPDVARAEARLQGEASKAVAATASLAPVSSAPRQAIIADARACVPPAYPMNAHRNGESGTVQLALLVGNDGRVLESKVQNSSGSSELDRAARKALSQCKFKAPGNDRQAEPVWAMLEYVFSLD